MATDGLNAFDAETRREIEFLLRPRDRRKQQRRIEYQVRTGSASRSAKPEGAVTRAARLYEEHRANGGQSTQRAWATEHGVNEKSLSAELYYRRNPMARYRKNERLRQRRTPPAL